MSINTSRHRVPIAPYETAFPGRPIRYVLANHSDIVFITFKDGSTTTSVRAAEEPK
jgi:hypothetical protein